MNRSRLKNVLLLSTISLILVGCGEKPEVAIVAPEAIPGKLPATIKITEFSESYLITGIGSSGTKKIAIINNKVVVPGEEVGKGVVLTDINSTYVTLISDKAEYHLRPESIQNEIDKKRD